MSNTSESEKTMLCANCGKGEESSINLKSCTACKLVKYCSRDCQIAHRPQHKKACKKRAKELYDELLFKQPPPLEDCPLCMIRLPTLGSGQTYKACCGKIICSGCMYADVCDHEGNVLADICPFCRSLPPHSEEEMIKRYEKRRVEMNDSLAIYNHGCDYAEGRYGLPRNITKALELWHRAAELGRADAYYSIANDYLDGRGVGVDMEKVAHYWELAAIRGHAYARHNLGCLEGELGNKDRAMKHFMIATKDGYSNSLNNIKRLYSEGHATKDDYAKALQLYQEYLEEIKSEQRDEAVAFDNKNMYYE